MDRYYDVLEEYTGNNPKTVKKKLKSLIKKDPNFLDSYLLFSEVLEDEGKFKEAEEILDEAYERAIKIITDENGNWPDVMLWGYLSNRHIIRTIFNKAISLWRKGENDQALVLFRKLLKTNPNDNVGARECILAIRMGMSFYEFESRFNKGGYYDYDLFDWFCDNYKKFPDEFDWWEKAIED